MLFTLTFHWVFCLQGTNFIRINIGKFVGLLNRRICGAHPKPLSSVYANESYFWLEALIR